MSVSGATDNSDQISAVYTNISVYIYWDPSACPLPLKKSEN